MSENEKRWRYIAEYRHDGPCVTKVRLKETPQNWRVLEAIPVYGGVSWLVKDGKLVRKGQVGKQIFDWYDEALKSLAKKLVKFEERAEATLREYQRQRKALETLLAEMEEADGQPTKP